MKFSVLLPTHNRLDLLRYAVTSVMRQNYEDWELIISDNASEEDVAGYVASLDEPRIRYSRTDRFVSVTENWNRCLGQATGDYVIMLGDDDALMPTYLSSMLSAVEKYEYPDVVFTDAYIYTYPGVMPKDPTSRLQSNCHQFFKSGDTFLFDRETASLLVQQWMAFELPAIFNMQFSLVKRTFIESLSQHGAFFQSLFPDYYATIVEFLCAKTILIYQYPLVIIGISPKSHGFYYFNRKMEEATSLLHDTFKEKELAPVEDILLPGDWILTGWLTAAKKVQDNYAEQLRAAGIQLDTEAYRRKMLIEVCKSYYRDKAISKAQFHEFRTKFGLRDWLTQGIGTGLYYRVSGLLSRDNRGKILGFVRSILKRSAPRRVETEEVKLKTILEVIDYLSAKAGQT